MRPRAQCPWAWEGAGEFYRRCQKVEGHTSEHRDGDSWVSIGAAEGYGWRVDQ